MKNSFLLLILMMSIVFSLHGEQKKALSPYSIVVNENFQNLKDNLKNEELWESYLYVFPKTKVIFEKVFLPNDFSELYEDSNEYIVLLKKSPKRFINQVIEIIFKITKKGAPGCCDPWSSLHMLIVELAYEYPVEFASILKRHPMNEQNKIIAFVADWEAIAYSEEYQKIIEKLKEINEVTLITCFEDARKKRAAQRHD